MTNTLLKLEGAFAFEASFSIIIKRKLKMFKKTLKTLPLLIILIMVRFYAHGQCSGCTYTKGTGGGDINLGSNETLCIVGDYTGAVNFNGANATVCIATGASWTPPYFNLSNSPTIDIYGTFNASSSFNNT